MSPLVVKMTSMAEVIAPKLHALGKLIARAFNAFAEARVRAAVPEWRLREVQDEIDRYHRMMQAVPPPAAGGYGSSVAIPPGGAMRGARGSAESRSSIAARPSPPRRVLRLASGISRFIHRLVDRLHNPPGSSLYQPELHYMRGPGPKWRAKHAPVAR